MNGIIRVEITQQELDNQIPHAYMNYKLIKAGIPLDAHGHVTDGRVIMSKSDDGGAYLFEWIPSNVYCKHGD